jgi:hypothetical protein
MKLCLAIPDKVKIKDNIIPKENNIFTCERMYTYEPCKKRTYITITEFLKKFDEII